MGRPYITRGSRARPMSARRYVVKGIAFYTDDSLLLSDLATRRRALVSGRLRGSRKALVFDVRTS
eukprot:3627294-Alexandrium_andersonii.AAC.1